MKFAFLFFLMFLCAGLCFSQNQVKKWYFGGQAGLSFMTTPPSTVTSVMTTNEGCASIADASGNTLFYTDGFAVFNSQNVSMANGIGLNGGSTTTQSAIIIKQPGNANIYYVVSLGGSGGSLCYSTIDMTLAAGLGSVTVMNTLLYSPSTEKLVAVKHCNGVDTWIISHELNTNKFRCNLVTSTGINPVSVISPVGSVHTGSNSFIGYLKVSPNGKKLGLGIYGINNFELYDFDPSTGIVSNQLVLANLSSPYGCEFSPDGTKFYGTREQQNVLYQWDLCAGNSAAIIASQYTIGATPGAKLYALQVATDGKIYISRQTTQTLAVINNPNVTGVGCNFVDIGLSIAPGTCRLGLPNFTSSFFNPPPLPFSYSIGACQSNVSFSAPAVTTLTNCNAAANPATNLSWNFGDPGSGQTNVSTLSNPTHIYTSAGTYTAQLILNYLCRADTLRELITIANVPATFSLSGNLNICKKQSTTLAAVSATGQGTLSYLWSPASSTGASITVSPTITTVYTVTGTDAASCTTTRTVQVIVNPCTGIVEQKSDIAVNIYPNPTDGKFMIETTFEKFAYQICNQLGEVVERGFAEKGKQVLDMKDVPNGIYFVELKSDKIEKVLKLVKKD